VASGEFAVVDRERLRKACVGMSPSEWTLYGTGIMLLANLTRGPLAGCLAVGRTPVTIEDWAVECGLRLEYAKTAIEKLIQRGLVDRHFVKKHNAEFFRIVDAAGARRRCFLSNSSAVVDSQEVKPSKMYGLDAGVTQTVHARALGHEGERSTGAPAPETALDAVVARGNGHSASPLNGHAKAVDASAERIASANGMPLSDSKRVGDSQRVTCPKVQRSVSRARSLNEIDRSNVKRSGAGAEKEHAVPAPALPGLGGAHSDPASALGANGTNGKRNGEPTSIGQAIDDLRETWEQSIPVNGTNDERNESREAASLECAPPRPGRAGAGTAAALLKEIHDVFGDYKSDTYWKGFLPDLIAAPGGRTKFEDAVDDYTKRQTSPDPNDRVRKPGGWLKRVLENGLKELREAHTDDGAHSAGRGDS
jgi:hypothetical protein